MGGRAPRDWPELCQQLPAGLVAQRLLCALSPVAAAATPLTQEGSEMANLATEVKLYGRWSFEDVEVKDISLEDYIACKPKSLASVVGPPLFPPGSVLHATGDAARSRVVEIPDSTRSACRTLRNQRDNPSLARCESLVLTVLTAS